jgi:hypothetical protein
MQSIESLSYEFVTLSTAFINAVMAEVDTLYLSPVYLCRILLHSTRREVEVSFLDHKHRKEG